MSVHRTADGRFYCKYYLPGDRTHPVKEYFGRGAEAKLAAEARDLEIKTAKHRGVFQAPPAGIRFQELAQRYLDQKPLSKETGQAITYYLRRTILPLFGHKAVQELSMRDLVDLDAILAAKGRSVATRNRYGAYCRAICQWGFNNELAESNPFAKFKQDKKREGHAPDLITAEELQAIWAAAADHIKWFIECMINLGVRPGRSELFGVRIADIDWDSQGIWITRSKTHSRRSLLPVRPEFLATIKELILSEPERKYLIEYQGKPLHRIWTAWKNTLRRAGITRRIRPYDLRHYYATSLLSTPGADIKAVSELMGHSSANLTISTYYHLLDRQKRTAVDGLRVPNFAGTTGTTLGTTGD